jgi:hypothetical protein
MTDARSWAAAGTLAVVTTEAMMALNQILITLVLHKKVSAIRGLNNVNSL